MTLLQLVRERLLPRFAANGARLSQLAERFPEGPVDLELGGIVVRVDRDFPARWPEVQFSSAADLTWFTWREVAEYFHQPAPYDPRSADMATVVDVLGEFLQEHLAEVTALFETSGYADRKPGLLEARVRLNRRLFTRGAGEAPRTGR